MKKIKENKIQPYTDCNRCGESILRKSDALSIETENGETYVFCRSCVEKAFSQLIRTRQKTIGDVKLLSQFRVWLKKKSH